MLKSRTRFWNWEFGAANAKPRLWLFKMAAIARNTAGDPWKREMKQLEASGRCFGPQFRKTTKYPKRYMMQKIEKKVGNHEALDDETRVSIELS